MAGSLKVADARVGRTRLCSGPSTYTEKQGHVGLCHQVDCLCGCRLKAKLNKNRCGFTDWIRACSPSLCQVSASLTNKVKNFTVTNGKNTVM